MEYVPKSARDSLSVRYTPPIPLYFLYDKMIVRSPSQYKGSGFDVDKCGVHFWNNDVARVLLEFHSIKDQTSVPEPLIPSSFFLRGQHSGENLQAVKWLYENGYLFLTEDGNSLSYGLTEKGWIVAKEHMEHYRSMSRPRMSQDRNYQLDGIRNTHYEYYLADKAESLGRYAR